MIWSDKFIFIWYETPFTIETEIEGKTSSQTAIFSNPEVSSCSGEEKGGMHRLENPGSCQKRDSATLREEIRAEHFSINEDTASIHFSSRF
jgi:hypothetical protein